MKQGSSSTKPAWDNINKHITPHARANTLFHHEQTLPLQCSHHYCHIVEQPAARAWCLPQGWYKPGASPSNVQHMTIHIMYFKSCLLQYLETGDLDPVLISSPPSFSSSGTEVIPSLLEEASNGLRYLKVLQRFQQQPKIHRKQSPSSTTVIGVGGEPHKEKEAGKDSGGFKQRGEGTYLKKIKNWEWQCCFTCKFLKCMD